MKLETAMRMAVVCGMYTVQEAVRNIQYHCTMLFSYQEVGKELKELFDEYEEWVADGKGDTIPKNIAQEEEEKLEKYFAENPIPEDFHVEELDWSDFEDKGENQ